ncbi:histidine phosphotransferase [Mycena amicta]|nr:histidine phosphotransferase [Mycena amicta]
MPERASKSKADSPAPTPVPTPSAPPEPPRDAPTPVPDKTSSEPKAEAINMEVFSQILELDEDDDVHEFSKGMLTAYFSQASSTFEKMDKALADKKLMELSELGHFLKGSSAALGISRVQEACERMQNYGGLRNEDGSGDIDEKEAISRIELLLPKAKSEYAEAERWLKKYYADKEVPFDDDPPTAAAS